MINIDYNSIRHSISGLRFGKIFLTEQSIISTNTGLKEHIKKGIDPPAILTAEEQTGGKGRMQRIWYSPSKKGIWISAAFPSTADVSKLGHYNFLCSLVISSAVEEITGIEPELKWPNDILIKGKKVCGILSESVPDINGRFIVITGMGLNVNIEAGDFPEKIKKTATSLLIETGRSIDRHKLLLKIILDLNDYYDVWIEKGIEPIYFQWLNRCSTIGKEVEIKTEKLYISGTAKHVNKDGSLLLEEESGRIHNIYAGDLEYIIN